MVRRSRHKSSVMIVQQVSILLKLCSIIYSYLKNNSQRTIHVLQTYLAEIWALDQISIAYAIWIKAVIKTRGDVTSHSSDTTYSSPEEAQCHCERNIGRIMVLRRDFNSEI
ncbi:hypothetical protein Trydic_g13837 [Trypoxylus dichotomus]